MPITKGVCLNFAINCLKCVMNIAVVNVFLINKTNNHEQARNT
jgi:hypothetical protein